MDYDPDKPDFEGSQRLFKGSYVDSFHAVHSVRSLARGLAARPESQLLQTEPHAITQTLVGDNPTLTVAALAQLPTPENPQMLAVSLLKQAMQVGWGIVGIRHKSLNPKL